MKSSRVRSKKMKLGSANNSVDEPDIKKRSIGSFCAVPGCSNYTSKTKGTGVSYHKFPRDLALQKVWIKKIRRGGTWNPEKSTICSIHFQKEDFERDLKAELLNLKKRNQLKPGVVPSLHLPSPNDSAMAGAGSAVPALERSEEESWSAPESTNGDDGSTRSNSPNGQIIVFEVYSSGDSSDASLCSGNVKCDITRTEEVVSQSMEENSQNSATLKLESGNQSSETRVVQNENVQCESEVCISEYKCCEQSSLLRAEISKLRLELKARDDSLFILEQSSDLTSKRQLRQIGELKEQNSRLMAELKEKNEKIASLEDALATDSKLRSIFSPEELKRFLKKAKKLTDVKEMEDHQGGIMLGRDGEGLKRLRGAEALPTD